MMTMMMMVSHDGHNPDQQWRDQLDIIIMLMLIAMAIRIDDGHKPEQQYGDQPNNDDVDNYNNDDE